jgi:acyl carrier protein
MVHDVLLQILQSIHSDVDFLSNQALIEGGVLDSFDIITLCAEVNDRLDITIPPEEIIPVNFNSFQALCRLLERLEDV